MKNAKNVARLRVTVLAPMLMLSVMAPHGALQAGQETAADDATPQAAPAAPLNVNDIAVLHWYQADQVAGVALDPGPLSVAFDGSSMWVGTNATLWKLRASDGGVLGSYNFGTPVVGLAFDGICIWTTAANGYVSRFLAYGPVWLGSFTVDSPLGVAFDGGHIWVVNQNTNSVTLLDVNGVILGKFPAGFQPRYVAFDGANVWVTNSGSNTVTYAPATAHCRVPSKWECRPPASHSTARTCGSRTT